MSAFLNKKLNMGISASTASGTQNVTGAADITLFSTNGFDIISGASPGIYLPTTSTIYLPKGFYYFIECTLKMYRNTNQNYLDYAIVDTSNNLLSNEARCVNISGGSDQSLTFSYSKKAYAFIDATTSSKTVKVRVLRVYDVTTASSTATLVVNGQQDATSSTNFVHSEPQSNIIIKSWKPQGFENHSYILINDNDINKIALTSTPQLTSSFKNKYASFDGLGNYTYLTPTSPITNDFLGVVFESGTGSFILKNNTTGILLTGSTPLTKYSVRKSFLFRYDGSEWIDIGEFNSTNLTPLYS
jgi:hypothetical protein